MKTIKIKRSRLNEIIKEEAEKLYPLYFHKDNIQYIINGFFGKKHDDLYFNQKEIIKLNELRNKLDDIISDMEDIIAERAELENDPWKSNINPSKEIKTIVINNINLFNYMLDNLSGITYPKKILIRRLNLLKPNEIKDFRQNWEKIKAIAKSINDIIEKSKLNEADEVKHASEVTITINMQNEAFENESELPNILKELADRIENGAMQLNNNLRIMDSNGNSVGTAKFK